MNIYIIFQSTKYILTIFLIILIIISYINNYTKEINYKYRRKGYNPSFWPYLNISKVYPLFNYIKNEKLKSIYFNITFANFWFSFKYKIVKLEYYIGFYENINNIINPSDITLLYNLHVICQATIKNISSNSSNNIYSLPNIYENKYFKCIEFFYINETLQFGIKIYETYGNVIKLYPKIYLFNEKEINYKSLNNRNDSIFNPIFIHEEYDNTIKNFQDEKINQTLKLKKSYILHPLCNLKRNVAEVYNYWIRSNIYGNYFCFCKGLNCLKSKIWQKCKFYFYLNIIDNNRYLYNKTEYIFTDFIFDDKSFDDTYPVFRQMEKENLPVHYITGDKNIYNEYCYKNKSCLKIIPINKRTYFLHGNFLEKYLTLLLKLKVVVSGKPTSKSRISKLFYNLEYVTYIAVGHGVCYFKDYLYSEKRLYGQKMNDKILIPPSDKIINITKKYGWKDENIIKLNLPRWDKYNDNYNKTIDLNYNGINNNSIFIMFTWRNMKDGQNISSYYINNILELITNDILNKELKINNIELYYTFHRFIYYNSLRATRSKLKRYKNIKIIKQKQISDVLAQTQLVLTDFSSIIFDLMYRRKPYIIYIPDVYEPNLEKIYKKDYYKLINSMKNGNFQFENVYFNVNETVNKIIYYIHNKFQLENKLAKFYDSFSFKKGNNIGKFIEYLKSLK